MVCIIVLSFLSFAAVWTRKRLCVEKPVLFMLHYGQHDLEEKLQLISYACHLTDKVDS